MKGNVKFVIFLVSNKKLMPIKICYLFVLPVSIDLRAPNGKVIAGERFSVPCAIFQNVAVTNVVFP